MRGEGVFVCPTFHYCEMVCARRVLLEYVVAEITLMRRALFGDALEQNFRFLPARRRDVHVGDQIQNPGGWRLRRANRKTGMDALIVRTVLNRSNVGTLMRLKRSFVFPAFDDDEAIPSMNLLERDDLGPIAIIAQQFDRFACSAGLNLYISDNGGHRSRMLPIEKLRVGINFGNTVLVNRNPDGTPHGIAVDLAHELSRRLNVPLEFTTYESAGRMAESAKTGDWDVAFLAADPARAQEIVFTEPYFEIDSTYLVRDDSPLHDITDVDRDGIRIALSEKSAYDLFLTRNIQHATLVRASSPGASVEVFFKGKLDALAGIRPMLDDVARSHPGTRVLEGRFTAVQQAIGTPRGNDAMAQYLRTFIEEIKRSGFVARVVSSARGDS
jgi:polar amino acid transport system substrate-binding protein